MNHLTPFKMVLDFRDLVFVVVPSLTGCSVAVLDRASSRRPWSEAWAETFCDKAAPFGTLNVLGFMTYAGGIFTQSSRPDARDRALMCAEKVSQFVNWPEFDSRLIRSKDGDNTILTLCHAILGHYVIDPSVAKTFEFVDAMLRKGDHEYDGREVPAFLSKSASV